MGLSRRVDDRGFVGVLLERRWAAARLGAAFRAAGKMGAVRRTATAEQALPATASAGVAATSASALRMGLGARCRTIHSRRKVRERVGSCVRRRGSRAQAQDRAPEPASVVTEGRQDRDSWHGEVAWGLLLKEAGRQLPCFLCGFAAVPVPMPGFPQWWPGGRNLRVGARAPAAQGVAQADFAATAAEPEEPLARTVVEAAEAAVDVEADAVEARAASGPEKGEERTHAGARESPPRRSGPGPAAGLQPCFSRLLRWPQARLRR